MDKHCRGLVTPTAEMRTHQYARGDIGIMGKKMETTRDIGVILGLFRVYIGVVLG